MARTKQTARKTAAGKTPACYSLRSNKSTPETEENLDREGDTDSMEEQEDDGVVMEVPVETGETEESEDFPDEQGRAAHPEKEVPEGYDSSSKDCKTRTVSSGLRQVLQGKRNDTVSSW